MRKENRLASETDFRRVRSEGRSWAHPYLVLHARPSGLARFRLGVAAGKRSGGAVERNRIRRRVREIVRARLAELSPGWDVIVTARPPAGQASFEALRTALEQLLRRSRLLSTSEAMPPRGGGAAP